MHLFFDTNALLKLWLHEEHHSIVEKLILNAERVSLSELTRIECISTLWSLVRQKALTPQGAEFVEQEILYFMGDAYVLPLENIVYPSILLLKKQPLRSLDAIQLASFIKSDAEYFVTFDIKLRKVCAELNIPVWPEHSETI